MTATDRATGALTLLERAAAVVDRMIGQVLSIGSDRQRIASLQSLRHGFYVTLSLVLEHFDNSPAAVQAALDLVLRRKAIAAEATAAQRDAVLGGRYPALRPKLEELGVLRMQIAQSALAGPGPEGTEAHRRRLAEWSARREGLEAELARQVPEMNLERRLRAADRRAVALALPEGVALVEFVRFPVLNFRAVPARGEEPWRPARYAAFVLRAGDPDDVKMIDLGEAEPIDLMIADFRASILDDDRDRAFRNMTRRPEGPSPAERGELGTQLRASVFDRLKPALGAHTRLLITPDGDLARLPFKVLPDAHGGHLLDAYRISYLSCGRDVLRFGATAGPVPAKPGGWARLYLEAMSMTATTGQPGEPLVVADPDFDLEAMAGPPPAKPAFWSRLLGRGKKAVATSLPPVPTPAFTAQFAGRHSRDLDRDGGASCFDRLPGTRVEGERIAALLGVSPWLEAAALEGRLKAACRSPRILHLATHGFFLPDQKPDLHDGTPGAGRLGGPLMEDPMLRSGLALAGANTWLKAGSPPEEAEDGLLTAEDVSGLDLLATELVVLSACETGLGQGHVGEGVFGLRRAFVLAGARTLVMSLWKVPDGPTCELMEDFYRRLLTGEGRAEALRQLQLALKAKYPDPYYWGAFHLPGRSIAAEYSPTGDRGHRRCDQLANRV